MEIVVISGVLAIAVIAVAAVVVVLAVARRRGAGASAGEASPPAILELERQLAAERERSSRMNELQHDLRQAQEGQARERDLRVEAEKASAVLQEARTQAELALSQLKSQADLAAAEQKVAIEGLQGELSDIRTELTGEKTAAATLRETLAQERRQADEKLKLLSEAKQEMTKEFQVLANEVMTRHGEAFTKQNKESLEGLLTPLKDKMKEFQDGLQSAHTDSAKERAALSEQIKLLSEQSAKMSSETTNLTRALKGEVRTQGAWGELVLSRLLENSGLRPGEEYVVQSSHVDEDGARLRPDVIVNLPGGQHVIIDSKVSLVAFEGYVNAEADEERSARLDAHLASMRAHIKNLASKEYQTIAGGGLDYVIMFIPIEGALAAALQRDPGLTAFAVQNNVAIATPTTLMVALRTIDNVWKVERRNKNAEDIAVRAGRLYDKFVGFVGDMQDLGKSIDKSQKTYNEAMGKLHTGRGNLLGQTEALRVLGAKTGKALPKELLDAVLDDEPVALVPGDIESSADA